MKHAHGEVDPTVEYLARAILDESANQYLIQWEDHPDTGEKYDDSWEPKDCANKALRAEWKQVKKQRSTSRECHFKPF